ncbi:cupin domain-containing protein [Microbacterium sp. MPKO10]|uniref:cupin domain-containing protein n=1 Tax=Microbacterium sp. MPKO10 TaxID=2989818 RepID=UPI00223572FB|nr:cupin domain-containing protein [Microbacterium sp. MPKO10]MCW4457056.1 cupin domain-containing protein [Microbacterium sp. MPKO10]
MSQSSDRMPKAADGLSRSGASPSLHTADVVGPDDPSRELSVRRPNTDDTLPHYGVVGDNYTILLTGADTNGRYALIDMNVPAGGGPPPHRHDFEEMFHVTEGEIEVTFRGHTTVVQAGETVNIPARAPHFFRNASEHNARMLGMVTPPGLDEYFSLFGTPLPGRMAIADLTDDEKQESMAAAIQLGPRFAIDNMTD